ncbi:TonB-dependent receptor [Ereboglobus sp. PH5-10]|uniref:TonB-dependent receptor n=1 Tax=Ereboglobus sp. PH5-10 TaxID=2940629 RepID=UPI002407633F|nr:TonB-dependent receptor [Ereboglobus sp. PH5-10]MDF9827905.1 TonB-dependent receptor [Ereboglobus sp. PH5-10]
MNNKPSYSGAAATVRTFIITTIFALLLAGNALAQNSLVWTGATDANWDTATQNWTIGPGGAASAFANGDTVRFDDTSSTTSVSIPAAVSPGAITVNKGGDFAFAGGTMITGGSPLLKQNDGVLSITGIPGFTGTATVEGGMVAVNGNVTSSSWTFSTPILLSGGTVTFSNSSNATSVLRLGAPVTIPEGVHGVMNMTRTFQTRTTFLGSGTLTMNLATHTAPRSDFNTGNFSGFSGELRLVGSATARANTGFSNASWLNTSMILDTAGLISDASAGTTRTLDIGALGSVNNAGIASVQVAGATGTTIFSIGAKNLDTTFDGAIIGANAALTKVGTGMLTLTGVNTYTGTTTVSAGALHVTGQLANTAAVEVAGSAALGGSGTITTSTVTFEDNTTLLVDASVSGALHGLKVVGSVTLGSTLKITPVVSDGEAVLSGNYTVLHATGGITGTPTLAWDYSDTGVSASLSQTADSITVTITAALPPAPSITSSLVATGTVGVAFNYTITADNNPASFTATGLPAGLDIDTSTGVISGTPTSTGVSNVTITATNLGGSDSKTLEITIAAAPVPAITSTLTVTGTIDAPFSYQIAATNLPDSYNATPLPANLSVDTSTGLINGTLAVAAAGVNTITLSAINASGTGTATLTLNAYPLPAISGSPLSASGTVGEAFSFSIANVATGDPTSYGATGLPDGLTLAPASGVISGAPTAAGTTTVTISATNQVGVATAQLQLDIAAAWSPAPSITSELTVTGTIGQAFSYQIEATNSPTIYTTTELPAGLAFSENSGLISGTPTEIGLSKVYIAAANSHGTSDTVALTIAIIEPAAVDALVWAGTTDNIWDKATVNWTMAGLPTNYNDGDKVLFNDASVAVTGSVSITTPVAPASVTVDTTGTLILTPTAGNGLSGAVPLLKKGAGMLAFSATNSGFTGTTTVEAGILRITSPSNGDFGLGPVVLAGGTLSTTYLSTGARAIPRTTIIVPEGKHGTFNMPALYRYNGSFQGSGTLVLNFPVYIGTTVAEFGADFTGFHGELEITGTGVGNLRLPITDRNSSGVNYFATEGWADTSLVFNSGTLVPIVGNNTNQVLPIAALSGTGGHFAAGARSNLAASTGKVTYRIGAKNLDTTFAGSFSGTNISIEKIGTGMLTLAGVNTHTGTTTVAAGALRVASTGELGATTLVIADSAAFGGSGIVATDVSYGDNAVLLADSDGSGALAGLTVVGSVTFPAANAQGFTVTPVAPDGVTLVNGTYTILEADGGFINTPTFTWSYPDDPAITATFSVINSNKLQVTIAGGAIAKPTITSALTVDALAGPFQYTFEATNDPASPTQLSVDGLDGTGLSFDSATGVIGGTPAAGRYNLTISASNSSGATTATLVIIIYDTLPPVPVITSPVSAVATVGEEGFIYNITASNDPTSFAADNLPDGLSINAVNGVISGIAQAAGVNAVTLYATNIAGTGTAQLELTVSLPPPEITSPASVTTIQGESFIYQITASNDPLSYSADGFPVDFNIDVTTGLVTGAFATTGTTTATVFASNLVGSGSATVTITVLIPAPVIQNADTASGMVGADFTYQIDATNDPTSYAALNLPAGLSVDTSTGLITGKPGATGSFTVSLVAMNGTGPGTKLITLVITGESSLTTLAGSASEPAGLVNGSSMDARFSAPTGAAADKAGNLYVADTDNNVIRKIAVDGTVTTFATGFNSPSAIVIDTAGSILYVADTGSNSIKKIDTATGTVTALAITGTPVLDTPHGLAIDETGNLYVADTGNHIIRKIDTATGTMTILAGTDGTPGSTDDTGVAASFDMPMGLALNADASLLCVADTGNSAIRVITLATALVDTLDVTSVTLNTPQALVVDSAGILYVVDTGNNAICAIDASTGIAATITDTGTLNAPGGIVIDDVGEIYVTNTGDNTILVLQTGPRIITSPIGRTVDAGTAVTFTVAASGAPSPTYQWYKDTLPLAGETDSTLTITSAQRTDAGTYFVIATNATGSAQSDSAVLGINGAVPPPSTGDGMISGSGGGATGWLYLLALAFLVLARRVFRASNGGATSVTSFIILAFFVAFAPSQLPAQSTNNGVITGVVSSEKSGVMLSAAEVTLSALDGKTTRTITQTDGSYRFGGLEPGDYTVRVTYSDLDPQTKSVALESGATANLDFAMTSEIYMLERFSITAEREGQAAAIQRQRQSDVMVEVVTADAFGNLIDSNPGELLKNLPGVFVDYTGGDTVSTMSIRGISGNEGSFTVDGNEFANSTTDPTNIGTDSGNRGVAFQTMSIDNIESLEVFKAPPPSSPANANGGVINAKTRNAFDQKGRRFTMAGSLRLNTAALNFAPVAVGGRTPDRPWAPGFSLAYSEAFLGNRLGISLNLNAYETYSFSNQIGQASYYFDIPTNTLPSSDSPGYMSSIQSTESSSRKQNRSASLNLDYKLSRTTSVFLRTSYNDGKTLAAQAAGFRLDGSYGTVITANSNYDTVEIENAYMQLSAGSAPTRRERNQAWHINPGVKHKFRGIEIDYDGYYSRSFKEPRRGIYSTSYRSPRGHFIIRDLQSKSGFTIQQLDITPETDYLNLDNYDTLTMSIREANSVDKKWGGKANIRIPTRLFGQPLLIQSGVVYTDWERTAAAKRANMTLNDTSAARPNYGEFYDPVRKDSWNQSNTVVPNWISTWKVYDYYAQNPDMFTFNQETYDASAKTYARRFNEKVYAGYLMGSMRIAKLNIMTGARYEYTHTTAGAYKRSGDAQWEERSKKYGDIFPNLQLKYNLTKDLILRAAYTMTIGRPGLQYLYPRDNESSNSSALTVTVTRPNTALKPQYSHNFDLSAEYYIPKRFGAGVLTAGVFRKDIRDYIVSVSGPLDELAPELVEYYSYLYEDYPGYYIELDTAFNVGKATMDGFEISYRQKFSFLPSFLKNFEIYEAFSYAHPGGDIEMTGHKKMVSNTQLKYRARSWSAQLSYYWCDKYLKNQPTHSITNADGSLTMGSDGIYMNITRRIDFSFTYQFSRTWAVSLDWRNILGEPEYRVRYGRLVRYVENGTLLNLVVKCNL